VGVSAQRSIERSAWANTLAAGRGVLVTREIAADVTTPVGAFLALDAHFGSDQCACLLESAEGPERFARYSLLGFSPRLAASWTPVAGESDGRWVLRHLSGPRAGTELACNEGQPARAAAELAQRCGLDLPPGMPALASGLVGAFGHDLVRTIEPRLGPVSATGASVVSFAAFDACVVFDRRLQRLVLCAAIRPEDVAGGAFDDRFRAAERLLDEMEARLDAGMAGCLLRSQIDTSPLSVQVDQDGAAFRSVVTRAKESIAAGDIIQVVLSRAFRAPAGGLDPFDVYRALRLTNPSPYLFFLRLPDVTLAGASPEALVRVSGDRVVTRPIAGTRRRGADEVEDGALEAELRADTKEQAEHVMLVDLARNDIGRVSRPGTVEVTKYMDVERYSHVMHLVSQVEGTLRPDLRGRPDAVLAATFPAGTLSGAPKVRALEILHDLESSPRGLYGGAVGRLSGDGDVDLAIGIRMVEFRGGELVVRAGAGIVFDSQPEAEFAETEAKAAATLQAVRIAKAARMCRDRDPTP